MRHRRFGSALGVLLSFVLVAGADLVGACEDRLQVTAASASGPTVLASISNSSSSTVKGYLVLDVVVGRRPGSVSVPLSVPGDGSTGVTVTFAEDVMLVGGDACENDPGGITESPDPILIIVNPGEEDDEGQADN